jgi:hypothetical protein
MADNADTSEMSPEQFSAHLKAQREKKIKEKANDEKKQAAANAAKLKMSNDLALAVLKQTAQFSLAQAKAAEDGYKDAVVFTKQEKRAKLKELGEKRRIEVYKGRFNFLSSDVGVKELPMSTKIVGEAVGAELKAIWCKIEASLTSNGKRQYIQDFRGLCVQYNREQVNAKDFYFWMRTNLGRDLTFSLMHEAELVRTFTKERQRRLLIEQQNSAESRRLLGKVRKNSTEVFQIKLVEKAVGDRGAAAVATAMMSNRTVHTIDLSHNHITMNGAQALGAMLRTNPSCTSLSLEHNRLDAIALKYLARGLEHNETLKTLHLGFNRLGNKNPLEKMIEAGPTVMAEALRKNTTLTTLSLVHSGLGEPPVMPILDVDVGSDPKFDGPLRQLEMGHHLNTVFRTMGRQKDKFSNRDRLAFKQLIKHRESMQKWSAEDKERGVIEIADALRHNRSLQTLDLADNHICDVGGIALAKVLPYNKGLRRLVLQVCTRTGVQY